MLKNVIVPIILVLTILSCIYFVSNYKGCDSPRPNDSNLYDKQIPTSQVATLKNEYNVLLLSGGAANGAWGVGVWNGWKESNRPKFDVVTGVSTGSLLATAIFLDEPKYDEFLKKEYTSLDTKGLFGVLAIAEGYFNGVNDKIKYPLKEMIKQAITEEMIDEVAKQKDRYLYVGATNLDKGCLQVWNMVEIAKTKDYNKFRDILLASCSMPIVLPPVFIDGAMYYDGGVTEMAVMRSYFIPSSLTTKNINVYLLFNGRPSSAGSFQIKNNPKDIGIRLMSVSSEAAKMLVVYKIQSIIEKNGGIFNFSYVPENIPLLGLEVTPKQMLDLYNEGYSWGKKNNWYKDIPLELKD